MDLTTITVQQFQAQFRRDFPYLDAITYVSDQLYNAGTEVYYPNTLLFYTCLVNGTENVTPGSNPTVWQVTADNINNYVQDQDITNAFAEAQVLFNQALFTTDAVITLAYLYCTAHFLCNDLKASSQGINSTGAFPVSSRSVGSVSEAYSIPKRYMDSPILSQYTSSSYGMKYLAMALPNLAGNFVPVFGRTNP